VYTSGRREDIGRIRDGGTYFSPDWKQGGAAIYLGGITEMNAGGQEQACGQISWCSMAARVAAAREVTSSLL
jgi:hypothetical protein